MMENVRLCFVNAYIISSLDNTSWENGCLVFDGSEDKLENPLTLPSQAGGGELATKERGR